MHKIDFHGEKGKNIDNDWQKYYNIRVGNRFIIIFMEIFIINIWILFDCEELNSFLNFCMCKTLG